MVSKLLPGEDTADLSSLTSHRDWENGLAQNSMGNYLASIDSFKRIPDGLTAKTCFNIAQNYMDLSRYECAIYFYSQALHLDPYLAIAYFCRANCYRSAGDPFQGALDYTSALDVSYLSGITFDIMSNFDIFRLSNIIHT